MGLSAEAIEGKISSLLETVLSQRRNISGSARSLAKCSRQQQDHVLSWLSIITKTNTEMGYQFIKNVPKALRKMNHETIEKWIIHSMDIFDELGLYPGTEVLSQVDRFAKEEARASITVTLDKTVMILDHYFRGLSGREIHIKAGNDTYTDTETAWLPKKIAEYSSKKDNFILYKAKCAHLWAQIHHGTFRRSSRNSKWLSERLNTYSNPALAIKIFSVLEAYRLDACISRTLPGLALEMATLARHDAVEYISPAWRRAIKHIENEYASVEDTIGFVDELYVESEIPKSKPWQSALHLDEVEATTSVRINRESIQIRDWLIKQIEQGIGSEALNIRAEELTQSDYDSSRTRWKSQTGSQSISIPETIAKLFHSTSLDVDLSLSEYLIPTSNGETNSKLNDQHRDRSFDDSNGLSPLDGGYYYDEWDFQRQNYRKNWCYLREIDMPPSTDPLVNRTLEKYSGLVLQLRRTFEGIRGVDRRLKRQPEGDDIDLEAIVEAQSVGMAGHELPDRLFTKPKRLERDTAVIFMVDVSGSTKGWINDAERESLVLLCEAIEVLGDQYAIYGFSGMTRKRCELYRIKHFHERYNDEVKTRIAGIKPKDYTRMGVTIRHLTYLLRNIEAQTRLLVTLSDGKPDDYDGYRGEYGIEDTRKALIEARQAGIHPFCITIDKTARDYLPRMYGEASYTLVSDVKKLPGKVSEIYRRLTT
ncbi:MAG: nitric oxide reductase activation protein [Acidiferrobacteraceae bacterium]|nr:nitric oxide reductase activation protein [Acidiferrobacteraceae bacterium]